MSSGLLRKIAANALAARPAAANWTYTNSTRAASQA
jgi:hypothetical protein